MNKRMKVFTGIILSLDIIGGAGFLILYPLMLHHIGNDSLLPVLSVLTKIFAAMTLSGLTGGFVRALILLSREHHKP